MGDDDDGNGGGDEDIQVGDDGNGNGDNGNGSDDGGNGNGDNGTGSDDGGNGNGDDGNESDDGGEDQSFEGLSFEFTDTMAMHSPRAERSIEQLVGIYEDDTGADVSLDIGPGPGDQQWLALYENNEMPPVHNYEIWTGGDLWQWSMENDAIYELTEYQGDVDDEVWDAIEWAITGPMADGYRGYDLEYGLMLPTADLYFANAFTARRDHYEEAGIDPEEFPPESYEEFIEQGTTLQEEGPGSFAAQIMGDGGDLPDCGLNLFSLSLGGDEGKFYDEDWEDTIVDNDVWKEAAQMYVDVFQEHELGHPETPTMSDEQASTLLAQGEISLTFAEPLTLPLINDQNPDLIDNKEIMWGKMFDMGSGEIGWHGITGFVFSKPPDNADESEWERKRQAGLHLAQNYYLDATFQEVNILNDVGLAPIREDIFDDLRENMAEEYNDKHLIHSILDQMEASDTSMPGEPNIGTPFDQVPPPMQEALQGERPVEDALDEAAGEIRNAM